jgi:hypothetical protein
MPLLLHYKLKSRRNKSVLLYMVVYTYNPSTSIVRQEDWDFKARLVYIGRPCLKNNNNNNKKKKKKKKATYKSQVCFPELGTLLGKYGIKNHHMLSKWKTL